MGGKKKGLTVADFFCGAGGFSEGFRQMGFEIRFALDFWKPAVETHQYNHPECEHKHMNILDLKTWEDIDTTVPDTDVIIGSPPCVAFSGSNKAGKADKSLGVALMNKYLAIIAVKKNKKGSVLKYWALENVPNAAKHLKKKYTFDELDLPGGKKVALELPHGEVYNAANYGAPQTRKRYICGNFEPPKRQLSEDKWVSVRDVIDSLGNPRGASSKQVRDPTYGFDIPSNQLTDHHYDARVSDFEWEKAKRLKIDHGYMGKMSFPEDLDRPSRTVMATRSASTREALILEALDKKGKHIGYRLPTIREIASFMSFPITYQFKGGSEGAKYRLVGNAVCPKLSAAIAGSILRSEGLKPPRKFPSLPGKSEKIVDLNGTKRELKKPGKRQADAKYDRHIPHTKIRSFRVSFTNKDSKFSKGEIRWTSYLHYGSGSRAEKLSLDNNNIKALFRDDKRLKKLEKKIASLKVPGPEKIQSSYIDHKRLGHPDDLLSSIKKALDSTFPEDAEEISNQPEKTGIKRSTVPARILAGMYAMNIIVQRINH